MNNNNNFLTETLGAADEMFGGTPGTWATKALAGAAIAIAQSVEAATIAIAIFLVMCIMDAILGVMRVLKKNIRSSEPNTPIKPWRMISGPASKWFVGGIVLLVSSFFDHVMFGASAFLGGPMLKFMSGVVLGAITIEVAAKADYLQGWGLADKLRERFPEFFAPEGKE